MIRSWILLTGLIIASTPLVAANLTETTDFSDDPFPPTIFSLDLGINILTGDLTEGDSDYLIFDFLSGNVVAQQTLISATFNPAVGGQNFAVSGCTYDPVITCIGNGISPFTTLPLEFGTIQEGLWIRDGGANDCSGGCGYVIEIVLKELPVSDVPEPSTWLLTGAGMLGLAIRRRKQTHRQDRA